jgi:arylsulfatase A-like enzyme
LEASLVARHLPLAAALGLVAAACDRGGSPHPKNLLLVCVDTLRADELGAYGREPSLTPALDGLARASVVFERAHATASWTLPSIGSVFTSFFPSTTGLWNFDSRLADAFPTLAERFQAAGFDTHGIASHVFFQGKYGLVQGFGSFDDELCHRKGEPGWRPITSPAVSAKAERWLEERARSGESAPWLLFVHFFDPHVDYLDHEAANPAASTRAERERYRSEIAFTDRHVGALLAGLERSGFARDTVVVFFSDHGESFLEHPPIRRHSYGLYEEELRVPLFLRVPGLAPRRVGDSVRTVDLLPTLLALFGLDDEHAREREGVSLVPLLAGSAPQIPPQLAEIRLKEGSHANALVLGPHKLYQDVSNGRLQLFDLEDDPREQHDLSGAEPALRALLEDELRAVVRAAEAKGARYGAGGTVELSPEEIRNLEELGYAGEEKE